MSGTYPLLHSVSHLPRLQNLHGRTRTITFNLACVAGEKKSTTEGRQSRESPPYLGLYFPVIRPWPIRSLPSRLYSGTRAIIGLCLLSGIIFLSFTERDLTLKNRLKRTHELSITSVIADLNCVDTSALPSSSQLRVCILYFFLLESRIIPWT